MFSWWSVSFSRAWSQAPLLGSPRPALLHEPTTCSTDSRHVTLPGARLCCFCCFQNLPPDVCAVSLFHLVQFLALLLACCHDSSCAVDGPPSAVPTGTPAHLYMAHATPYTAASLRLCLYLPSLSCLFSLYFPLERKHPRPELFVCLNSWCRRPIVVAWLSNFRKLVCFLKRTDLLWVFLFSHFWRKVHPFKAGGLPRKRVHAFSFGFTLCSLQCGLNTLLNVKLDE